MPSQRSRKRSGEAAPPAPVEAAAAPADYARPLPVRPAPAIPLDWLFGGFVAMMAMGFVVLRLPGVMAAGNEMNADRAAFTVVNAATLSGFQLNIGFGQFRDADGASGHRVGAAVVLVLTLGGTFFTLTASGLAAVRVLRLRYADQEVVGAAGAATVLATLAGATLLMGHGRGLGDALLMAASAFGNSGVHTGALPGLGDWRTHLVLLPLAVLGGLGLPVLMELYGRAVGAAGGFGGRRDAAGDAGPLSSYTLTVLRLTAGVYLAGLVLLLVTRDEFWADLWGGLASGGWTRKQGAAIRYALVSSSVQAVNARTAGFPFEFTDFLPRASQWVLMLLMLVGGSSAGTAGGVKVTTALQLVRGVRDALAGRRVPRAFGVAAVWLASYLVVVAVGAVVLMWQVPQMASEKLVLLSASAIGNVGLSNDAISLVRGPLFTLSFMMLAGRLLPLAVLWWMVRAAPDADLLVG